MNPLTKIFSSVSKFFRINSGESFMSVLTGERDFRKTHRELLEEYRNLVYSCISVIAQETAKYEPVFLKKDSKGNKVPIEIVHPFSAVLENPNPSLSEYDLFEGTQSFKELVGEAFWYVEVGEVTRQPKALYPIRPDRVKILIGADGEVSGYMIKKDDGTEIPLDVDEVIHFKTFNPINPYRGFGPVQAGYLYVDTENVTSKFQHNFIKNSASPSGVLTLQGKMTTEAFQKLKKQWRERYGGEGNAGRTMFLRNTDAKFEKLGLSLTDLSMESLKSINKEDVLETFRVPEAMLGKTDSTGLGRSNIESIEYIFAKRTIEPKLIQIDDTLTKAVRLYYKDNNIYVEHKSQIPEDKEAKLREFEAGFHKWLTANDILRETNRPISEDKGADQLYYQFNEVPLSEPAPEANATGKMIKLLMKKKADTSGRDAYFKQLDKIELRASRGYEKGLTGLLETQKSKVLDLLKKLTKSKKQVVDVNEDDLEFELTFTEDEIALSLLASIIKALATSGQTAIDFVGVPETEFVLNQATRDAVFKSTERLMRSFNKETALKLQKQIAGGLQEGESLEQLTVRVESVYEEATGFRARRIADTEAHKATNFGVAEGYRQSGVKRMKWVTDSNPCPLCAAMEGTITEIGVPFLNNGDTVTGTDGSEYQVDYTDVEYADLHPNCNCKLEPIIE